MKPISALATCVALPVVVLGLTGAAAVPEPQMYTGVITNVEVLPLACPSLDGRDVSGHWSARMDGSDMAIIHIKIKVDGKAHANWSAPFTVTLPGDDSFTAVLGPIVFEGGAVDTLTVSLRSGTFTYELKSESRDCNATFVGTLGR